MKHLVHIYKVSCDECGFAIEVIERDYPKEGWYTKNYEDFCPDCIMKKETTTNELP